MENKGIKYEGEGYEEGLRKSEGKGFGEITEEEAKQWRQEVAWCQEDFWRFLKWVKIIETPVPGETGGGIKGFEILPHVRELIEVLLSKQLISVLKSRQVYVSTTLAVYHEWYAWGHEGAKLLLFSKGQPEAKELLAKSHRVHDLLPAFLRTKIEPDSTEELGFPVARSSIKAFPSTQSAGISYTSSVVTCDEHAEHPYAEENYISSKPTRDKGGQFISVFTAHPYGNDNLATAIFTDALAGKNDFVPLFFPYDVVPGRDEAWYEKTRRNIPERELARLSPDLYMAKNYPRTIEEALAIPQDIAVFDKKVLNIMMQDCMGEVNQGWEDLPNAFVHIYKDFHIGNFYIGGSDVSEGVGRDFNVTCIMDVKNGDIVADIMSQTLSPEKFAYYSVKLLERYHSPLWWIEESLWGRTVIKVAKELNYRRLGCRDARGEKPGFFTDEKNRADLFGALIPAINDHQIRIYNRVGLEHFYNMIRNMHQHGKIEARAGGHDDYVIALGLCWLKRKDVRTGFEPLRPIDTLNFIRR